MILKQTNDWLVLNKPSQMHSLSSPDDQNSVENWVYQNFPEQKAIPEAGLLHRLDYLTSGCLAVGINPTKIPKLRENFRQSSKKIYWAWVEGQPNADSFDLYFRSRYKRSKKASVTFKGEEKEKGSCRWSLLQTKEKTSLLEVELLGPGKRHQIRAGLAFLGHPILGDRLYGRSPPAAFFGLHARSLEMEQMRVIAPPPTIWPES